MLEIQDLKKIYDTGDKALCGVDASINNNEIVAMIGPSGAGKSTFIRCINRLTEPTDGKIWLDDVEITGLSKKELRKQRQNIGFIFQEYNLFERLTVMENVLSGRLGYISNYQALRRDFDKKDIRRAYEVLEIVGMEGLENNRVSELSGGQRQRVGIARAVLQEPKIILADEPTSSLDPQTSRKVMELLKSIASDQNIPIFFNIHEVHIAEEFSDRIIGLNDGNIVFRGRSNDLDNKFREIIYESNNGDDEKTRTRKNVSEFPKQINKG